MNNKKQLEEAQKLIIELFKGDIEKATLWWNTSNLNFGGSKPCHLFAAGRGHKVLAFIKNALDEM